MAGKAKGFYRIRMIGIGLLLMCTVSSVTTMGQKNTIDFSKVPSEWVWKKGLVEGQWQRWESYRKEVQRAIPNLPPALEVTYLIAFGEKPAMWGTKARHYEVTLKIKSKVYNSHKKQLEVEGETGCWVYAQANSLTGGAIRLPGMADKIRYKFTPDKDEIMYVCNLETETDAWGNKVLYASTASEKIQMGHYFTVNKGLPVRRLSWKEFAQTYYQYTTAIYNDAIRRNKGTATGEGNIKELNQLQQKLNQWYADMQKASELDQPAVIERSFDQVDPKRLSGIKGYNVWVNDPAFFDSTKHPDEPQFIILKPRPQLGDPSKEAFIGHYLRNMNMDVVARLAGEKPKKPGGANTILSSLETAKTETAGITAKYNRSFNFTTGTTGSWPAEWYGNKNAAITDHQNSKWLGLSSAGYAYPKQLGKIEDGFELAFDLEWNKDISYYTAPFALTIAQVPYDQVAQQFTTTDRNINYNSFYDDVTAGFHRITLYFDPHFNYAGELEVVVSNETGVKLASQKFSLPHFYKEKNSHRIRIGRKNGKLWVMDNDQTITEQDIAFPSNLAYNAFVFSRYTGNNDGEKDIYYLNNISVRYK